MRSALSAGRFLFTHLSERRPHAIHPEQIRKGNGHAYSKIWLKKSKEKYAAEHAEKLQERKRAYDFLMKNHGEKLTVDPHEFDAWLKRMKKEDAAATAELESVRDQLTEMKKLKRKLERSTPELARKDQSLPEQLAHTQERDIARKPTTQKRHEQSR